jgi:putative FmdB family regulatory protein
MVEAGMGAESRRLSSAAAMPIYEYRCENGHLFEVMQRITEDPVTTCPDCGAAVQRVFHPVAVHFKGSGFYNTDYGTARRKREQEASKSDGGGKEAKKSDSSSSSSSSSDSGSGSGSGSSSSSGSSGSTAKAD